MTSRPTPRYYVLHGEDELARSEALKTLRDRLGPPEIAALNTTVFEAGNVSLPELKNACNTIPFMAKRRMVIVHGILSHLAYAKPHKSDEPSAWRKRYQEELGNYLPHLPETTRLIFVEPKQLPKNDPILRQATQDDTAYVRAFVPPRNPVQWVRSRAKENGGEFSLAAAQALVQAIGDDPRVLDQEIVKLLTYTNCDRPVDGQDVSLLVPLAQEAVIFDAVDAMGQRDGAKAAHLIHNLLDHSNEPLYLFAMIVRQFRLLIQIKELATEGKDPPTIAREIKLHPYPTGKLYTQARNFSLGQLEQVHRQLLEIDVQIKTGQIDSIVALDLLIAALAPPS